LILKDIMLDLDYPIEKEISEMPSLNHSYICSKILKQLFEFEEIEALTELTLDIDKGLTPDICVYPVQSIKPNFSRDVTKFQQMPILAIEVVSAHQNIQDVLEKSEKMVKAGVQTAWTIEPFTRSIFVTTEQGENIFYNQKVEFQNIFVDFKTIFGK